MHCRSLIGAIAIAAVMIPFGAQAADDAKYPDWKGAWARFVVRGLGGQPSFDQTKPWGFGQQAPLTEEYKKVLEESLTKGYALLGDCPRIRVWFPIAPAESPFYYF